MSEACRLVEEGFLPIAGGTELNIKHSADASADRFIDITDIGLNYIESRSNGVAIGATARIAQIESSDILKDYRALKIAAATFTPSVKHLATIGGNIAESVPSADTAPPMLVFDAKAVLTSLKGERVVPLETLFAGLRRNTLKRGEIIREFLLPPFNGSSFFKKIGRSEDDLAVTSMAISLLNDVRIALGSASNVPMRARRTEEALTYGMERACSALLSETKPRSSIRASIEYRKKLEVELLKCCLEEVGYENRV
jgi:carbon-monoxide dehydrogenase medium subunit